MFSLIGIGIVMGLAFAVPPGIVMAETFRRGAARGFPAAFGVQLGSLIGDATYALLALAGLAVLVQNPIMQRVLGPVGAVYIVYQASKGLRHALKASAQTSTTDARVVEQQSAFATGAVLSLTNPWAIGYWIGPGGALATSGAADSISSIAIFFFSFFGVCVAYAFVMSFVAGWMHRAMSARTARIISLVCSLAMVALGIGIGYRVVELSLNA